MKIKIQEKSIFTKIIKKLRLDYIPLNFFQALSCAANISMKDFKTANKILSKGVSGWSGRLRKMVILSLAYNTEDSLEFVRCWRRGIENGLVCDEGDDEATIKTFRYLMRMVIFSSGGKKLSDEVRELARLWLDRQILNKKAMHFCADALIEYNSYNFLWLFFKNKYASELDPDYVIEGNKTFIYSVLQNAGSSLCIEMLDKIEKLDYPNIFWFALRTRQRIFFSKNIDDYIDSDDVDFLSFELFDKVAEKSGGVENMVKMIIRSVKEIEGKEWPMEDGASVDEILWDLKRGEADGDFYFELYNYWKDYITQKEKELITMEIGSGEGKRGRSRVRKI